jgi:uncharacterized protein (TIGR03000 family)
MFRKAITFGGLLLLAGAMVLVTPGFGQARGGGGGHGGGGHGGGGFHGGGFGGGGFHGGGFGGAHFGGFRGGYYGHPYAHSGYNRGYGYGGGYGFYGYGVYPFYGDYAYDPYAYNGWAVTEDSGYDGSYGGGTPYYSYGSYPAAPPATNYQSIYQPAATDNSAHVTLTVPAGARVTFGGTATTSTGPVREYQSPSLTPGRQYTYEVRATWDENGKEVTQTQQVEVTAGGHVSAVFPMPKR